ncbi:MAG: MFS transporter [Lentisphaeria bacterium]|nr:MFS transporter [Lentisphaeria bacterium]
MGLVSLFTDFSSEMMNPLLPIFIAGLLAPGSDVTARAALFVGLMEGIAETTSALLKIVSGRISDRLGKRKVLVLVGYGLSSLCRPLMAAAVHIPQVVLLKFFDRVGKGIRTSPRDALIGDSVPREHRGLAFSFHRSMDHSGAIIGPLVAILVLYGLLGRTMWKGSTAQPGAEEMRALRWLFAVALLPGLAAMVTLAAKVRETTVPAQTGKEAASLQGTWRRLPGRFYAFVGVVALFALGNSSDMFIVFLGWTRFGFGMLQVVALWIGLHISKIVFSIPGGLLSDRIGRRPIIIAGWLVYAAIYLGLAVGRSSLFFVFLVLAYGFYHGMTEGAEKALVADFTPADLRGTAYGLYHGAVGLAALPASLVFGAVWRAFGPAPAFGLGAALAASAAVLLAVLLRASSAMPGMRETASAR